MQASLTPTNLLEPRVTHLEEQLKMIADRLSSLTTSSSDTLGFLRAKVLVKTVEFITDEVDPRRAVSNSKQTPVEEGQDLSLSYPQQEVEIDGSQRVVMRRRNIDSDTAELTFSWVVVYWGDADGEADVNYVGDFSPN